MTDHDSEAGGNPGFKRCSTCAIPKPATRTYFHRYKNRLRASCIVCSAKASRKRWHENHPKPETTPLRLRIIKPKGEEAFALIPFFGKLGYGRAFKISLQDVRRVLNHRWYQTAQGYAMTYLSRGDEGKMRTAVLHRFLFEGKIPDGYWIDHRNRDRLDFRRSNLRVCLPIQNSGNSAPKSRVSQFKGVTRGKQRKGFVAQITVEGKVTTLGTFSTDVEAAKAYDQAAAFYFGEFAYLNFQDAVPISAPQIKSAGIAERNTLRKVPFAGLARRKGSNWRVYFAGKYYGSFVDPEEAARKYDDIRESMGYPRVNFPDN